MDMRSLNTFIKTAELLHFGRASRGCNLSPSALTRTIQRLEEEIGRPLFLRDNRSVALTEAGNQLLVYARTTVSEWKNFQQSLASMDEKLSGVLSIYASISAVYSLLPNVLEAYRSDHPEVQIELRTGDAEKAIEQVLHGEIDLAVAALPDRKQSQLEFMPLAETPLLFIAAHPLDHIDFSQTPLVVPQSGVARHRLDQWLKEHGIVAEISTEVSGNEALIAMVRLGAGVGIVPKLALERSPFLHEVHEVQKAPRLAPYVVGLCSSKRNLQRPAVQAMWQRAEKLGSPD